MNQLSFPFEKAIKEEASRHVMIDALPVSNRLKEALKFLDAYGRARDGLDGSDVLSSVTRDVLLKAVGCSPNSRRSWQGLREALKSSPYATLLESECEGHLLVVHLRVVFEATSHSLTVEAIAGKAAELARRAPAWSTLVPPSSTPPQPAPATARAAISAQGVRAHRVGGAHPPSTRGAHPGAHPPQKGGARLPKLPGDGDACARASRSMDSGILNRSPDPEPARSGPSERTKRPAAIPSGRPSPWGPDHVDSRELREPLYLARRYRRAVELEWVGWSEQELFHFLALAHLTCRQHAQNPWGLFTTFLDGSHLVRAKKKRPWREQLSYADETWAREGLRKLVGHPLLVALTSGPATPQSPTRDARPPAIDPESDFVQRKAAQLKRLEELISQQGAKR